MPKYSTAFGMDVHLRSTTVCALDADLEYQLHPNTSHIHPHMCG